MKWQNETLKIICSEFAGIKKQKQIFKPKMVAKFILWDGRHWQPKHRAAQTEAQIGESWASAGVGAHEALQAKQTYKTFYLPSSWPKNWKEEKLLKKKKCCGDKQIRWHTDQMTLTAGMPRGLCFLFWHCVQIPQNSALFNYKVNQWLPERTATVLHFTSLRRSCVYFPSYRTRLEKAELLTMRKIGICLVILYVFMYQIRMFIEQC